jgi:hypothetical protein
MIKGFRSEENILEKSFTLYPYDDSTQQDLPFTHTFIWLMGTMQRSYYYSKLIEKGLFPLPKVLKLYELIIVRVVR